MARFVFAPDEVRVKPKKTTESIMKNSRFFRAYTLLLTAGVALTTLSVGMHATEAASTPNVARVKYNLASGASSGTLTPASSTPVLVMECKTTSAIAEWGK